MGSNSKFVTRKGLLSLDNISVSGDLITISGSFNSTYTTVNTNSASWAVQTNLTDLIAASGGWNSTQATVNILSGDWDSVVTTVNVTSADWNSTQTTVNATSGAWEFCIYYSQYF